MWRDRLVEIALIVAVGVVAIVVLRVVMGRVEGRLRGTLPAQAAATKRARTATSVVTTLGTLVIALVATLMVLEAAGVSVTALVATAGIGGVALGLGAQNLVRDVVAGLFILSENQYDVGDQVSVAGVEGTVEAISLRTTVLRGLDGTRLVVSNGEIRISANSTRTYSRCVVGVPVSYDADIDAALAVVRTVASQLAHDTTLAPQLAGPPMVLGVDALTDTSIMLKAFVETVPGRQTSIGREFRRRLVVALREAGVPLANQSAEGSAAS